MDGATASTVNGVKIDQDTYAYQASLGALSGDSTYTVSAQAVSAPNANGKKFKASEKMCIRDSLMAS